MKKKLFFILGLFLVIFLIVIFNTEDLTKDCTFSLINCLEIQETAGFFKKMGNAFVCVLKNFSCVLGTFLGG